MRNPGKAVNDSCHDRLRQQAHALRLAGYAIREIAMRLSVPRSTVSDWMTAGDGERVGSRRAQPCKICGAPTTAKFGICHRNPRCHNEAMCHHKGYTRRVFCAGCGGPMRSHCQWRFCVRSPQCRRLNQAEAHRTDPERFKENERRWREKHAVELRERATLRRAIRGGIPMRERRGRKSSSWAGGRVVLCFVCGQCAGWRTPRQLKRRRRFLCKEHGRESWKWNLTEHQFKPQHAVQRVPEAGGDR